MQLKLSKDYSLLERETFLDIISATRELPDSKTKNSLAFMLSMLFGESIEVISVHRKDKMTIFCKTDSKNVMIRLHSTEYFSIKPILTTIFDLQYSLIPSFIPKQLNYCLVDNAWVLGEITEINTQVSLFDLITYLSEKHLIMPVELIILTILKLAKLIQEAQKNKLKLGTIATKDIFINYNPDSASDYKFALFVDFLNIEHLREYPFCAYSNDNASDFSFSIGVYLYCCLALKTENELPCFQKLTKDERKHYANNVRYVPGLHKLLNMLLVECVNDMDLYSSVRLQCWNVLLSPNPAHLFPPAFSYTTLLAGLYFSDPVLQRKTFSLLVTHHKNLNKLKISHISRDEPLKVLMYLLANSNNFVDESESCNNVIIFTLKFLEKLNAFKLLSKTALCIPALSCICNFHINFNNLELRTSFLAFLRSIYYTDTITLFNLMAKNEKFEKLLLLDTSETQGLYEFIHLLGGSALPIISKIRQQKTFSHPCYPIFWLQRILIHNKLQHSFAILKEVDSLLNIQMPGEYLSTHPTIIQAFFIVYELLVAAKEAEKSNKLGQCYKNKMNYSVVPVMIECSTCSNKNLCVSCGQQHENRGHNIRYMTHGLLVDFTCQEEATGIPTNYFSTNNVPIYVKIGSDSNKTTYNNQCMNIINVSEVSKYEWWTDKWELDLSDFDQIDMEGTNQRLVKYTEICFQEICSEDFTVEFIGTGYFFNNFTGELATRQGFVGKMPRFGSKDTFGVGITSDRCLFFTYNGFNLTKSVRIRTESLVFIVKFKNCIEKPSLLCPTAPLFIGETFLYLEKHMAKDYEHILKKYFIVCKSLNLFKRKSREYFTESTFNVFYDIQRAYSSSLLKQIFSSSSRQAKRHIKKCSKTVF
jgi:hypothetical protein